MIYHEDTGRVYVGSAISLRKRLDQHFSLLRIGRHKNRHLQNAWNKYGEGSFRWKIILLSTPNDLLFFEQRALDHFHRLHGWDWLFNDCPIAGSKMGSKMSVEDRRKLSERMIGNSLTKGRRLTLEHREKISQWNRENRPRPRPKKTEEEKFATKSKAMMGRILSQDSRRKISEKLTGHPVSVDVRNKISAALKGRKPPISGKKHTEEARRKICLSWIIRKQKAVQLTQQWT